LQGPDALQAYQINTGDYLLCRQSVEGFVQVVACFERKSLKDFVQSFKDGRYENRKKMLELRNRTGCQLYYIVEGTAFPNPDWVVCSGTKYQAILTAMTTLPLASGIHIIQTKDTQHTAERLRDFLKELDRLPDPYLYPVTQGEGQEMATAAGSLVPKDVTGVYVKDPDSLCMELWSQLTGISIGTAKVLVVSCSVQDFIYGQSDINKFKLPTGRVLTKKGRDSLKDLRAGKPDVAVKLLSGVNGLTTSIAKQILSTIPVPSHHLHWLCRYSVDELSKFPLTQKSRTVKLGHPRAERILKMLRWKTGCDQPVVAEVDQPPADHQTEGSSASYAAAAGGYAAAAGVVGGQLSRLAAMRDLSMSTPS